MTSHHDQLSSSRDYAREAEVTRHRLAHSLNELSDRLTPGQVFDEMLSYAKGGGGTFFRLLANASRESPIPTLLVGAGCMMFLSEKMGLNRYMARGDGMAMGAAAGAATASTGHLGGAVHRAGDVVATTAAQVGDVASRATDAAASNVRSAADAVQSGVRQTTEFARQQAANVAEGVRQGTAAVGDTMSGAAQSVTETARDLRHQAAEAADQVVKGAQSVAGTVQDYSSAIGEQVVDTAGRTGRKTAQAALQAKDSTVLFINEQPLLCAAIGLAVGAAIAAMLPSTETEDQFMGEASDAVKGAVGDVASEQLQSAKEAAGKVVQEARTVAEREGLTPAGAADFARNIGEKVKRVVSEAGTTASDELQGLAGNAKQEIREFAQTSDKN